MMFCWVELRAGAGRGGAAAQAGQQGGEKLGRGKRRLGRVSCWARGERKKRERVGPSEMERTGLLGSWAGFGLSSFFLFFYSISYFKHHSN